MNESDTSTSLQPPRAKQNVLGLIVGGILVVSLVFTALQWYQKDQEVRQVRSSLDATQQRLSTLTEGKDSMVSRAQAVGQMMAASQDLSESSQKARVELAAGRYVCYLKNLGCDKVKKTIDKIKLYEIDTSADLPIGFAIVTVETATGSPVPKMYLKTKDGLQWIVMYAGQSAPTAAEADAFELPASFR